MNGPQREPSLYHCDACGRPTDVHGSTGRSGPCPDTGASHGVDLLFHHRNAHDGANNDPDCLYCQNGS